MDKPAPALTHRQYEVLTASPTFKPWLQGWAAARMRSFFKDSLGLLLGRSRRFWDGAITESLGRLSPRPRPSAACSGFHFSLHFISVFLSVRKPLEVLSRFFLPYQISHRV